MKKEFSTDKWIRNTAIITVLLLGFVMLAVFLVDPFFQYRFHDGVYYLSDRYVNNGLIKNSDYDSVIMGSSMMQNFDMDLIEKKTGLKCLKLTMGGASMEEMKILYDLVMTQNKADTFIICFDVPIFLKPEQENHIPEYLRNNRVNWVRYLLSFEAVTRFTPVDLLLSLCNKFGVNTPASFSEKTQIKNISAWDNDYEYGADIVFRYFTGDKTIIPSENEDYTLPEDVREKADEYIAQWEFPENKKFIVFFPPYSALYWDDLDQQGYMNRFLETKQYLISRLETFDNIIIYDFQGAEFTADLDLYRDLSHYRGTVNDYMTECFADSNSEYIVNSRTAAYRSDIIGNINLMTEKYPDLFN